MTRYSLPDLGWSPRHAAQLTDADTDPPTAARITTVSRTQLRALSPDGLLTLLVPSDRRTSDFATGDWILTDPERTQVTRLLDRDTLLQRRGAGESHYAQLIAANVDTLAIVTSCNADYNEARLERYLALAASAGCLPLIVLTKPDMAEDADDYLSRANRLSPLARAITLNAKDADAAQALAAWAGPGQTLALVGSSGVGKTTLANALTGAKAATAGIREDDARGRHTTTARGLSQTRFGGWLIDTPGMRSLPLNDAALGIGAVFADIEALAEACRFRDCAHETEPGCAVQAAIAEGTLDAGRLARYAKLSREDAQNSEALLQPRARAQEFRKSAKTTTDAGRHRRGKRP